MSTKANAMDAGINLSATKDDLKREVAAVRHTQTLTVSVIATVLGVIGAFVIAMTTLTVYQLSNQNTILATQNERLTRQGEVLILQDQKLAKQNEILSAIRQELKSK